VAGILVICGSYRRPALSQETYIMGATPEEGGVNPVSRE
jgi:hypothetical protein